MDAKKESRVRKDAILSELMDDCEDFLNEMEKNNKSEDSELDQVR